MAKKSAKKANKNKMLRKGKKLEETKPLARGVVAPRPYPPVPC